ncbi:hypothetical protein SUNI508_03342 [Seiridium unicorne]|uniref:Folliculin-interacting protein N-terminal domain-containing protein n=1 Tax=Seiridium unicorne TaxID=138068 RepID=A0ABR2VE78_9PEZI
MDISEPLMDCNFPELLAGDLGRSEDVFRSKNLTAGPPTVSLTDEGRRKRRSSLQESPAEYLSSQGRDILSRVKSMQMVNQSGYSEVMAQAHEEPRKSSETTASESSGGMEPPSIAGREMSVTTAATSVTSSRFSPSDKSNSNSPVDKISNHSWVDLELEHRSHNLFVASNLDRCYSLGNIDPAPTPRSPRDVSSDQRSMSMGNRKVRREAADPFTALGSPTRSFKATKQPRETPALERSHLTQPTEFPTRRSSLGRSTDLLRLPRQRSSPRSPPSPNRFAPSIVSHLSSTVTPTRPPPSSGRASAYQREEEDEARSMLSLDDDEESDTMMDMSLLTPRDNDEAATPAVVSPLAEVEQWVEQSSIELSHLPQPTKDYQGSRIHVAPEVLDTLRISVACFPETMLLCSSLSIETLRGNSKKVRYRAPDMNSASQLSLNLPDGSTKMSKWKWLTSKKSPESSPTNLQFPQNVPLESSNEASASGFGASEWQAIKNIFPSGTDHLCDALYAHILAYNYISSICPRSAVVAQAARPISKQSNHPSISDISIRSDSNKIPRKAAFLLGLQDDPATPIAPPRETSSTSRGKPSFMRGKRETKSFGPSTSRSTDDHDQSLKDLRLGLAKCIARIVGTLRLTSSEELGTSVKPVDIRDIDPLFIRALCEVVRCNEER